MPNANSWIPLDPPPVERYTFRTCPNAEQPFRSSTCTSIRSRTRSNYNNNRYNNASHTITRTVGDSPVNGEIIVQHSSYFTRHWLMARYELRGEHYGFARVAVETKKYLVRNAIFGFTKMKMHKIKIVKRFRFWKPRAEFSRFTVARKI